MVNKSFIENILLKELKLNKMNYKKEQIRIACGMKLSFNQVDIKISGHAI